MNKEINSTKKAENSPNYSSDKFLNFSGLEEVFMSTEDKLGSLLEEGDSLIDYFCCSRIKHFDRIDSIVIIGEHGLYVIDYIFLSEDNNIIEIKPNSIQSKEYWLLSRGKEDSLIYPRSKASASPFITNREFQNSQLSLCSQSVIIEPEPSITFDLSWLGDLSDKTHVSSLVKQNVKGYKANQDTGLIIDTYFDTAKRNQLNNNGKNIVIDIDYSAYLVKRKRRVHRWKDVMEVHRRRYLLKSTAIELFLEGGKSFILIFHVDDINSAYNKVYVYIYIYIYR